ncbi:MAG TPA: thioredoxin domain-containing protein, partial [Gemmatimonadaceae bacterium]|nr:thioredoxin domain-containing protein [Gemmatimonadaceae bacterium]
MNEKFINIKVDREERPDIDSIYMQAVQALTGNGVWPMTVFLTPFGEPFYGGTYYPPEDRQGMPSFSRVLNAVSDAYRNRRESVTQTSRQLREIYDAAKLQARSEGAITLHALELAYRSIAQKYDVRHGGFEGAPKFPPSMSLDFLLRYSRRTGMDYALEMVTDTFRKMAHGGIYDQIGGGIHRYTVDAVWLVPHFEKMLYDNALFIRLGAHLWQVTHDPEFRRVTEESVKWVAREMTSAAGGFYSSLDADSEGEEGKFYVWDVHEIDSLLGRNSAIVKDYYGVTAGGNFEGKNIFHVRADPSLAAARAGMKREQLDEMIEKAKSILYSTRAKRVWPGRDEKILASWNGLMLRAVATAARAFERDDFANLAIRNGEFLHENFVANGRVFRSLSRTESRIPGFLEDYAAIALGFIALYELNFDRKWIERARTLADSIVEWFWDEQLGAFFDTPRDAETLIARPRDATDNATPSGTSLAVDLLLSLSELLHDADMRRRATFVLETLASPMIRYPSAFGYMLGAADMAVNGAVEVAIAGVPKAKSFEALRHEVATHYVPSLVLAGGAPGNGIALMEGRLPVNGTATAYVCRSYACEAPATSPSILASQLDNAGRLTDNT